jgi:hypothetical protein
MRRAFFIFMFLFFILLSSSSFGGFRCNGELISEGDLKVEVFARCGTPTWIERWVVEYSVRLSPIQRYRVYINVEEWYYNLGPNKLIRILRFENGILVDIRDDGYGY